MSSNVNIVINGKNLASKAIKEVTRDLGSAGIASGRLGSSLSSIARIGLGVALTGVGTAFAGLFASVKKDADWQQVSNRFEILVGDAQKAKAVLGDLQSFAAKTPLSFDSIADGAISLMAFGTQASDVLDQMRILGDLSMGDSEKLSRLVEGFGKLQSKGKASLEEINRFTENGVPLVQALADRFGKTTQEVFSLVSTGKVGFSDVLLALEDLTKEGGRFSGMLSKQAETVNGKWSTLKDTLGLTMIRIGEAFRPLTTSVLDAAISKLNAFVESESFDSFVNTSVRWATWAAGMLPKVGAVFSFVGETIAITARHAASALGELKDIVVESPVIKYIIELGGAAWEAVKTGLTTGDWSAAFGVGVDVFKAGVVLVAGINLASSAVNSLWTTLLLSMKSSPFLSSISNIGSAGIIGGASIAVALVEAQGTGNWDSFKNSISAAIIAGLAAGWLTKSPQVGVWTGTIMLNLDLGNLTEKLPSPEATAESIKAWFRDIWDMMGLKAWWEEKGESAAEGFLHSLWKVISFFDLVGAFVDLWNLVSTTVSDWWSQRGQEIGKAFQDSLWRVISTFDIVGAFVDLWKSYGASVVEAIKSWFNFDLKPEGKDLGRETGEGFVEGLEEVVVPSTLWFDRMLQSMVPDDAKNKWAAAETNILPGDSWWERLRKLLVEKMQASLGVAGGEAADDIADAVQASDEVLVDAGHQLGIQTGQGFVNGLADSGVEGKTGTFWEGVKDWWNNIWKTHSPSEVTEELGLNVIEGFYEGLTDPTWATEISNAWNRLIEVLESDAAIDLESPLVDIKKPSDPTKTAENKPSSPWSAISGTFRESPLGELISNFSGTFNSFISGIGGMVASLGSVQAVLDPLSTIFAGIMEVLSPVINSTLAPFIGILRTVGHLFGSVLSPVLRWLTPVIDLIGQAFVWLYNKVILPVGNGFIKTFNAIGIGISWIINGIVDSINWALGWLGVHLNRVSVPDIDQGTLQPISSDSLTTIGSSYIGGSSGSGVTGSSTSVQSYTIEVHQVIQGNVIGDGGLAALGEYFVRAVQAYMGNGGTVAFIQGR